MLRAMKHRRILPVLAVVAALAVAASGFGARFGVWNFQMGFQILRYAAYAGLAIAAISLVGLLIPTVRARRAGVLATALVIALAGAGMPLYWMHVARAVPPINDITTDPDNPPMFVSILPQRASAPVPASYPGKQTADAQRAGYPDLHPITMAKPPAEAFAAALAAARAMDWQIIATDAANGRIEATALTPWFGFRDDVVIRVAPDGAGSRVDIRSVSRVGKSDLGANARRIRDFTGRITQ